MKKVLKTIGVIIGFAAMIAAMVGISLLAKTGIASVISNGPNLMNVLRLLPIGLLTLAVIIFVGLVLKGIIDPDKWIPTGNNK